MITAILAPFALAFGLSVVLVPICRLLALRFGLVARPREDRWHQRPVALFGGVAIGLSFFACALSFGVARAHPVLLITAAAIFAFGLVDDILRLKASTKVIVQIALASVLVFAGFRLGWTHSITLDTVLTLVWIVGLTNAFNLLDNMDGLCAGTAIIAGCALLVNVMPGATDAFAASRAVYLAILMGATAGFLVYNVHPASIFMGDSGSLLIGLSFAAVTASSGPQTPAGSDMLSVVAGPVLVLLIPIFDTTLVTLSRWRSGRRASEGGRDHSSHRLVAIGLSERRAVLLLWALSAVGGALSVALHYVGASQSSWYFLVVGVFILGMIVFAGYLGDLRVYDDEDLRRTRGRLTPVVVEFVHKRRVAEVLLDFCLITFCYYAAYRLRFEEPEEFLRNFGAFINSLPIIVAAQMLAFFSVGVYRGVWRDFGMMDSLVVARGVLFGTIGAQLFILYVYEFVAYSRTVFAIDALLLLIAVTLSRASFRLLGEFVQRQRQSGTRAVIYGAGEAGGLIIREVLAHDGSARILGFIDEDPRKLGTRVSGYPVLGGMSALTVLAKAGAIDRIVIAARHLPVERLDNLGALCAEHNLSLSRLNVALEPMIDAEVDRSGTVVRMQISS